MLRDNLVLIRGGGDLASGVAIRLCRAGIRVVITELPQPLAVRRAVSFSEAVFEGMHQVEGVTARLIEAEQVPAVVDAGEIPVLVDPNADILGAPQSTDSQFTDSQSTNYQFPVVVDARLLKTLPQPLPVNVPLHIGLGPGFTAGSNCHAVIETRRSHRLGRVYWEGTAQPDSGQPEGDPRRVLRAPEAGSVMAHAAIGARLQAGQLIAEIQPDNGEHILKIVSPFDGVLRGLIRDGLHVPAGLKIGDVDARNDASACFLVSDKSLAVGGGVLEAILSQKEIRDRLYS